MKPEPVTSEKNQQAVAALVWITAAMLLLLGQVCILAMNQTRLGLGLSAGAIVLVFARLLVISRERGLAFIKAFLPGLLAGGALLAAVAAQLVVPTQTRLGLGLFVLSGALLVAAKPQGSILTSATEIPAALYPRQAWEPWFFLFLTLIALWTRLGTINHFPYGATMEEGELLVGIPALNNYFYTPHLNGEANLWMPTLVPYLSYACAKLFGMNIYSFRLASEIYGFLSILIFYFVARRITSPLTAAVSTLIYLGSNVQLALTQRFFPYSLLFFAPVAAFGLLLTGMRKSSHFFFLLAGLATGLCMHAYEAGRGVFLIFLAWMIWMGWFHRKSAPTLRQTAWFWGGFFIAASPIIIYMILKWHTYWEYVAGGAHPGQVHSLKAYLQYIWYRIPDYAGMFHVRADEQWSVHLPYQPVIEPVIGVLFGLGIFFCLGLFWMPLPAFLLLYFVAGMMPGLLGGLWPDPVTRRVMLVFPAIYLIGALVIERIRLLWHSRAGQRIFAVLALGLGLWGMVYGLHHYFYTWADYPTTRAAFDYRGYYMAKEVHAHPGSNVRYQESLNQPQDGFFYLQQPVKRDSFRTLEEFLTLDPSQDCLFLWEGYMHEALPFIQEHFPHAQIKLYSEKNQDPAVLNHNAFQQWGTDPFNPDIYFISIFIPRQDIRLFQALVDVTLPAQPALAQVFEPDFSQNLSGQSKSLAGAIFTNDGGPVIFSLTWPGWKLKVDGKPAAWNKPLVLNGGTHYFEISGSVPPSAAGPLPFRVMEQQADLGSQHRIVSLLPGMGIKISFTPGDKSWNLPPSLIRQELFPMRRFYDVTEVPLPFAIRVEAQLRVPLDGEYRFFCKPFAGYQIMINQQEVFNNLKNLGEPRQTLVRLKAGELVQLDVLGNIGGSLQNRTYKLYYQKTGEKMENPVPCSWYRLNL